MHSSKSYFLIDFTDKGITIFLMISIHKKYNLQLNLYWMDFQNMICDNDEHKVKAYPPIKHTEEVIIIYDNAEHPENADEPIDVTEE